MPRKRKARRQRLSIYKVFGLHCLLFIVASIVVNFLAAQFYSPPPFPDNSFIIDVSPFLAMVLNWLPLLSLHLGYVILITIDRLMRRLFSDESLVEAGLVDQLVYEMADWRAALRQRAAEQSSQRLAEKSLPPGDEIESLEEHERAAGRQR